MNQHELNSKLLEVCRSTKDRSKELKMLIILGDNISCDYDGPILHCCEARNLNHIKILVKSGADIISQTLIISAKDGWLDGVKYAIENGADIHAWNDSTLRWTSNSGHLNIVEYLVKNGAYIHANDNEALRFAAENGHLDVVQYLINNGANLHARDDEALVWAASNGHLDVVKYLVESGADFSIDSRVMRYSSEIVYDDVVEYLTYMNMMENQRVNR